MVKRERVVFLKISGERLGDGNPDNLGINPTALLTTAKKITKTFKDIAALGYTGLVVVPGAGNMVRGDRFIKANIAGEGADRDGRLATIVNADRLSSALSQLGTPNQLLTASSINYSDGNFSPAKYTSSVLAKLVTDKKVVIIGGGNGEDNATTDNAVAYYASDYAKSAEAEVVVIKGTKYDGVFNEDPSKNPEAKKIKIIGAQNMLADYERYSVVDAPSLQRLIEGGLSMVVYQDEAHETAEALEHIPSLDNKQSIGTLIVPKNSEPVFY